MDEAEDDQEEGFEEEADEADEPDEDEIADATVPPATPEPPAAVESIEDLLAKKEEARADDEGSLLNLGRDERLETLAVKVVPPQPTEFVCKNCYLVKHQSQLADKKKQLCRDCA